MRQSDPTKESGNERLTARLRDVDEQNALIVRREAADLIDLYEATIVAVVEKEQAALAERDALREEVRNLRSRELRTSTEGAKRSKELRAERDALREALVRVLREAP